MEISKVFNCLLRSYIGKHCIVIEIKSFSDRTILLFLELLLDHSLKQYVKIQSTGQYSEHDCEFDTEFKIKV